MYCLCVLAKMNELQARDLRAWCPLMHAAWSGSADVFRAVVVAIEDNLGRDQVWYGMVASISKNGFQVSFAFLCVRFLRKVFVGV